MTITKLRASMSAVVLTLALAGQALAQGGAANDPGADRWRVSLTPYLWAVGLEGEQTVQGMTVPLDVGFDDIFDNLDFASSLHLEASKGRWTIVFDPTIVDLGIEAAVGPADVGVAVDIVFIEAFGAYRFGEPARAFDLLFGARYTSMDVELNFDALPSVGGDADWVSPFIGGRYQAELSERWNLALRGDVGGFDVGSDFVWNASLMFGVDVGSKDRHRFWFGYRYLSEDYDEGSADTLFAYDVDMGASLIGWQFRF